MEGILTTAEIRRETGEPWHIINYAINRYGPEPVARLGMMRLWCRSDLSHIRASIEKTPRRGYPVLNPGAGWRGDTPCRSLSR